MSLKHALLGIIDIWNLSGYELSKYFSKSVNLYWHATHVQIYKTLESLNNEGFIGHEVVEQINVPNKKVYHITDKGKNELKRWLKDETELPSFKETFLLKLSFVASLEIEDILNILKAYKNKLMQRIDELNMGQPSENVSFARNDKEKYIWKMILKRGQSYYHHELEWLNELISGLEKIN
ncbi:MAG TPA: PadR family transcriptional regulator [Spirochaetota bacterium]|nr:PadR family transcriptional regulator [Spirochaetota bacterium]